MPGIVGLITKLPRAEAEAVLKKMLGAMHREDFYESGTWVDEAHGVYVGWTAPRGSFSEGMPLLDEGSNVCIVFSGEEYSRGRTTDKPDETRCAGAESAYLLDKYLEDGDFVPRLNGMFHGLIVDKARGEVTLFNDRFGMHRLCYHEARDGLFFGAEAKAILAALPELRRFDYRSLGEFASFSCVLEDRTVFDSVHVLPGGSVWTFKNATIVNRGRYFEPREWEQQEPLEPDAYYDELRSKLLEIVPKYFAGRQEMGLAITGGFDTRLLLACHPPEMRTLPCYTFGGPYRESQDVLIGRKIANLCRQSHEVISVGDEFLTSFPEYASRSIALTEGTVDVGRTDYYLSVKAREIAPAKVVGTYGSEIFMHAVMFKPIPLADGVLAPEFLAHTTKAAATYSAIREQHPVSFAAFSQSPWYHHGVLALEKSQLSVHSPYMDNDFVRTIYRAPPNAVDDDVRIRLIRDLSPVLGSVRSDRGLGGNNFFVASKIVNSILEFTFKAEYAYDYGMPQSVARVDHYLSALRLERLFLGRHKFLHFRVWYRDQLSSYVREVLLDPLSLSRPYLRRQAVERIVESHLKGDGNYTLDIHRLLTMELLHRIFSASG